MRRGTRGVKEVRKCLELGIQKEKKKAKVSSVMERMREDNDGLLTLPFLKSDHYYDLIKRVRIERREENIPLLSSSFNHHHHHPLELKKLPFIGCCYSSLSPSILFFHFLPFSIPFSFPSQPMSTMNAVTP